MTKSLLPHLCDDVTLENIKTAMRTDDPHTLHFLDNACTTYPADPRLTLLRGSVHANERNYAEAKADLTDTLAMAPDLHVARFMLGYLELCHGHAERAVGLWIPLVSINDDPELKNYANGMIDLVNEDFSMALARFRSDIPTPSRYPDIAHLVNAISDQIIHQTSTGENPSDAVNTHLLLGGYLTRH